MSRVTITLEDNEQGTVNQTVSYEMDGKGGFDHNSQSHQYSRVMLSIVAEHMSASRPELNDLVLPDGKNKAGAGIILLS